MYRGGHLDHCHALEVWCELCESLGARNFRLEFSTNFEIFRQFEVSAPLVPHRTSVTEFRIPTTIKGDTFELNDCKCVKIINVNGELRNEYESNLRSHRHYLSRSKYDASRNIQIRTGFEPMSSAIPVQCSGHHFALVSNVFNTL